MGEASDDDIELAIDFEHNEKGIVYFVGRTCGNLMMVGVNGEIGATLLLYDPFLEQTVRKVRRDNLLIDIRFIDFEAK